MRNNHGRSASAEQRSAEYWLVRRPMGAQEGVLHHFLGVERVLQQALGVVEQGLLESFDHALEGAFLPAVHTDRQLVMGRVHDPRLAASERVPHHDSYNTAVGGGVSDRTDTPRDVVQRGRAA